MILGTLVGSDRQKRLCPAAFVDNRRNDMARKTAPEALTEAQGYFAAMLTDIVATANGRS